MERRQRPRPARRHPPREAFDSSRRACPRRPCWIGYNAKLQDDARNRQRLRRARARTYRAAPLADLAVPSPVALPLFGSRRAPSTSPPSCHLWPCCGNWQDRGLAWSVTSAARRAGSFLCWTGACGPAPRAARTRRAGWQCLSWRLGAARRLHPPAHGLLDAGGNSGTSLRARMLSRCAGARRHVLAPAAVL